MLKPGTQVPGKRSHQIPSREATACVIQKIKHRPHALFNTYRRFATPARAHRLVPGTGVPG